MDVLNDIAERLPEEDRFFFETAFYAISLEFVVTTGYSEIDVKLRQKLFADFIEGLTPRRIIIYGIMLRARQYNQRDAYEGVGSEEVIEARRIPRKKVGKEAEDLAVAALKRYGKASAESE